MPKIWIWCALLILGVTACNSALPAADPTAAPTTAPTLEPTEPPPTPTSLPDPTATAGAPEATPPSEPAVDPADVPPLNAQAEYATDFERHTVPYTEILTLLRKDAIPAIDAPQFISVEEADQWLGPFEPVIHFQVGDDARAYPIQIFMWHEIVNDVVGELPVVITFCPLCNTAIAFERTFDGQVLDFGTTGRLRFSNLIMYDRQTETWWQQASGEGIAGQFAGEQLTFLPAAIIGWQEFKAAFPDGLVLSRDTGYPAPYGQNPYQGYDDIRNSPFAYDGPETPGKLPAMARVLTVDLNGEAVAYPYPVLSEVGVINDVIGNTPVAIFWAPGTNSALDSAQITLGEDVGAANSFSPVLDGEALTFTWDGENILDEQTNSVWTVLGAAAEGPLAGSQLDPVVGVNHFWFSWAAFKPDTRVYTIEG